MWFLQYKATIFGRVLARVLVPSVKYKKIFFILKIHKYPSTRARTCSFALQKPYFAADGWVLVRKNAYFWREKLPEAG